MSDDTRTKIADSFEALLPPDLSARERAVARGGFIAGWEAREATGEEFPPENTLGRLDDLNALYVALNLDPATATLGDAVKRAKALDEAVDAEKKYIEQLESSDPASLHSVYTVHPREGDVVVFEGEVTEAFMRMARRYIKEKYGAGAVNVPGREPLAPLLERIARALERQTVERMQLRLDSTPCNLGGDFAKACGFGAGHADPGSVIHFLRGVVRESRRLAGSNDPVLLAVAIGELAGRAADLLRRLEADPRMRKAPAPAPEEPGMLDAGTFTFAKEAYPGEMDALRNLAAAVGAWWAHPNRPGALVDGMGRAYRAWDRNRYAATAVKVTDTGDGFLVEAQIPVKEPVNFPPVTEPQASQYVADVAQENESATTTFTLNDLEAGIVSWFREQADKPIHVSRVHQQFCCRDRGVLVARTLGGMEAKGLLRSFPGDSYVLTPTGRVVTLSFAEGYHPEIDASALAQAPIACFDGRARRILLDHVDGKWFRPDEVDAEHCDGLMHLGYLHRGHDTPHKGLYFLSSKGLAWVEAERAKGGEHE